MTTRTTASATTLSTATRTKAATISVQPQRVPVATLPSTKNSITRVPAATPRPSSPISIEKPREKPQEPKPTQEDTYFAREYEVVNNEFIPKSKNGISDIRPEIISISDVFPFYSGPTSNKFINEIGFGAIAEVQAEHVRTETLKRVLNNIKNWDEDQFNRAFETVLDSFEDQKNQIEKTVGYIKNFAQSIEFAKKQTNIKKIPDSGFDVDNFKTLKDLVRESMQFAEDQLSVFSNTKIFLQLCADLKAICENYSYDLLNLRDPDRINDYNPITVDTTYTTRDGFRFSIDLISSADKGTPLHGTNAQTFNEFMGGLPNDPMDRIKLLLTILGKELQVSKQLYVNRNILQTVYDQADIGSPFNQIIGTAGKDIFSVPETNFKKSLISLSTIELADNEGKRVVFPLEQKYIDTSETNSTYIPGTSYFFDSIIEPNNITNDFNKKPFVEYSNKVSDSISNTKTIIESLFEINNPDSGLHANRIFDSIGESIINSTNTLKSNPQESNSETQSIIYAIFEKANFDLTLKKQLFQFVLLTGIAYSSTDNASDFFKRLGEEIGSTGNLDQLTRIAGNAVSLSGTSMDSKIQLGQYIRNLQEKISDQILRNLGSTLSKTNQDAIRKRVNSDAIRKALDSTYSWSYSSNNISNLVREIHRVAKKLDSLAGINGNPIYITQEDGLTKYNRLSPSIILLLIFETFCSFVAKYPYVYSVGKRSRSDSNSEGFYYFEVMPGAITNLHTAIESVLNNTLNAQSISRTAGANLNLGSADQNDSMIQSLTSDLSLIVGKLRNENKTIQNFLHVLDVFKQRFTTTQEKIQNSFSQTAFQSFVDAGNDIRILQIIKTPSQLRTALYIYDEYKERIKNVPLVLGTDEDISKLVISPKTIKQQNIETLFALFQEPQFNEARSPHERMKIVSIGIPVGLSERLHERIVKENIDRRSFEDERQQLDVVKISIYKRDFRFPHIIFKPKQFTFDLSMFVSDETSFAEAEPQENENFNNIVQRIVTYDYDRLDSKSYNIATLNELYGTILSPNEQNELFLNHIRSHLLSNYIQIMANGTQIKEDTFLQNDITLGTNINNEFMNLFKQYVNEIYGFEFGNQNLLDFLQLQNADEEVRDLVRLVVYGNTEVFEPNVPYSKIVMPKMFDRIFHIPILVDDFEIDHVATNATNSGRLALLKNFVQDKIKLSSDGKQSFEATGPNDIVFSDFFVTIETNL